jgi:hypothetical protein
LASGVPDLKIYLLIIYHDLLLLEIGTNGWFRHPHLLIDVLLQKGGLANARVTENDNLEKLLFIAHLQ